MVIVLRHSRCAKGVGFDQVGACGQVPLVNVANHVGPRDAEQLVVALHIARKVLEPVPHRAGAGVALAPVLRLAQLEALDHGAHGAVEDDDALGEDVGQLRGARVVEGLHSPLL
ncbi:hypothetical protein D3C72_1814120 [compost metagenome]